MKGQNRRFFLVVTGGSNQINVKFSFSEKPKKFAKSSSRFRRLLSRCPKHEEDCANFCTLLRKADFVGKKFEKCICRLFGKFGDFT